MAAAASSSELQLAFEKHLKQTKTHVQRIEDIFEDLDYSPRGEKCKAMEGLIEEASDVMSEEGEPEVLDAAIIAASQRVEHYEISAYGTARTYAHLLGYSEAADTLQTTLNEEYDTDNKLDELAKSINVEAM